MKTLITVLALSMLSAPTFALPPYTNSPDEVCAGLPPYDADPNWYDSRNNEALKIASDMWFSMTLIDTKAFVLYLAEKSDSCTFNKGSEILITGPNSPMLKSVYNCSKGQNVARWDHNIATSRYNAAIQVMLNCTEGDYTPLPYKDSVTNNINSRVPAQPMVAEQPQQGLTTTITIPVPVLRGSVPEGKINVYAN